MAAAAHPLRNVDVPGPGKYQVTTECSPDLYIPKEIVPTFRKHIEGSLAGSTVHVDNEHKRVVIRPREYYEACAVLHKQYPHLFSRTSDCSARRAGKR